MELANSHGRTGESYPEPSAVTAGRTGLGLFAVVTAAALWGLGGTVASRLFRVGIEPLELVQTRTYITFAGLALLLAVTPRRGDSPPLKWLPLLAFGVAIAVANACLFLSIKHLPVAVAMVLQNLAPAFVVSWQLASVRRRPGLGVTAGLLVALIGVALVVKLPTTPSPDLDLVGIGFGVATAVGVAAFSVLGSRVTRDYGAIRANTYAFGISTVLWLLVQVPKGMPDVGRQREHLAGVLVVAVLGTLVPFVLFAWGTARVGSRAGAINISLEPIFSAVIAWAWLGQILDPMQIVGGVVLIAAVAWLQSSSGSC